MQVHSYEADVTFVASAEVLQVGGSGPSFRSARTQAYQQLLLMMCGNDGKDVAPTSAPLPWAELVATAGGRIPNATVLEERPTLPKRLHGYSNVRDWQSRMALHWHCRALEIDGAPASLG